MNERWNEKMEEYHVTFGEVANLLGISKQTLTKKVQGTLDWTFPEMTKLIQLFEIKDPESYFFG